MPWPFQFNALPDKGFCEAVADYQIDQRHSGYVPLDGLRAAAVYRWPGAVHEGNGSMHLIIDKRADASQRDGLVKIMSGQEIEDKAPMNGWNAVKSGHDDLFNRFSELSINMADPSIRQDGDSAVVVEVETPRVRLPSNEVASALLPATNVFANRNGRSAWQNTPYAARPADRLLSSS